MHLIKNMKNTLLQEVFKAKRVGMQRLSMMDEKTRNTLEDGWDIEHAYYSSALEGSKIDRNEFDRLAGQV